MIAGISAAASSAVPQSVYRAGTGSSTPPPNTVEATTPADAPAPQADGAPPSSRVSAANQNVLLAAQAGEETNAEGLTQEEQEVVRDLQQTDQEVRAHEQAHKSVAGPYAGPISYETITGPDGREYAVGGSVQIDVSPVPNNPEATIRKMEVVERAALAPADPSPEDFAVARAAQAQRQIAQNELSQQRDAERSGEEDGGGSTLPQVASASEENDPNAPATTQESDAAQNDVAFSEAQTILAIINAQSVI